MAGSFRQSSNQGMRSHWLQWQRKAENPMPANDFGDYIVSNKIDGINVGLLFQKEYSTKEEI